MQVSSSHVWALCWDRRPERLGDGTVASCTVPNGGDVLDDRVGWLAPEPDLWQGQHEVWSHRGCQASFFQLGSQGSS